MQRPLDLAPDPAALTHDGSLDFEEFMRGHHERLYRALCLLTGDRHEAEDVMQEAFVRLLERWDRVRSLEDPVGYLYRTAMNLFRKRYRRALRALRRSAALVRREDSLAAIEERDVVIRALRGITEDQRAALVVTVVLGYTSEEAARILGARASTVRARATRARSALRQAMEAS